MSRSNFRRCLTLALLPLLSSPALSQPDRGIKTVTSPTAPQRRALVIGNANYTLQRKLKNPVNDATDLAAALREIGFQVTLKLDVDQKTFDSAVDDFAGSVHDGDTAVVFYAGHAIEVDGRNYLLPINFETPRDKERISRLSMPASDVQKQLLVHNKKGAVVLILDSCRNDPWGTRGGTTGGLAVMQGRGVYIAFAAEPGKPAGDNLDGRNGYFTKNLLTAIREPGLTIDEVFNKVREGVDADTKGDQVPFSNSGLIGRFVFRDAPVAPPAVAFSREPAVSAPFIPPPPVTAPSQPAPLSRSINPKDGLEYVWVPPGSFMMGCSPGDTECYADEKPSHLVTLRKGFWMGVTPVTQEAYQRVTGTNPSYFKGAKLPVESVSHDDAKHYCAAVGMRLPTEAEWEYAARAGTTGARYGNLDAIAWYDKNSGSKTHEVGQKQPNGWGLYDMLGNVWQWTGDWYADKYAGGNETDPKGPATGQYRTLRGGSWNNEAQWVRASYRLWVLPDGRLSNWGFRCVGE